MKKHLFLLSLVTAFSITAYCQNSDSITNKNYYSFFNPKPGVTVNYLRASDAIPIIIDELIKNGIEYYTIDVGKLIRINDSINLVVTISFNHNKKTYGFIYKTGHGIPPKINDRKFLSDSIQSYFQIERDVPSHSVKWLKINRLPRNIFLLDENCYWFLFDAKETNYPVSKTTAEKILREDIRDYLSKNGIN